VGGGAFQPAGAGGAQSQKPWGQSLTLWLALALALGLGKCMEPRGSPIEELGGGGAQAGAGASFSAHAAVGWGREERRVAALRGEWEGCEVEGDVFTHPLETQELLCQRTGQCQCLSLPLRPHLRSKEQVPVPCFVFLFPHPRPPQAPFPFPSPEAPFYSLPLTPFVFATRFLSLYCAGTP